MDEFICEGCGLLTVRVSAEPRDKTCLICRVHPGWHDDQNLPGNLKPKQEGETNGDRP